MIRIGYHRLASSSYGLEHLGEGRNMDYCILCSLTGTHVVMCDGCPRSFCLTCVRMDENNVPKGDWYCATCVNRREFLDMLDSLTPEARAQLLAEVMNKTIRTYMHVVIPCRG